MLVCTSIVDQVVEVDFDLPESHGDFFITRVSNIELKQDDGTRELISLIKVILPNLVDARDFEDLSAFSVCDGQGVIIEQATVPKFLLHDVDKVRNAEETPLPKSDLEGHTYQVHGAATVAILGDKNHQLKKTLLVSPRIFSPRRILR